MEKYYLIGELHGTNEAPEACWDILQKNKIPNLALEFPVNCQKEINNLLEGKKKINEIFLFWFKHPHDGRSSPAMKRLLIKAKEHAIKVHVIDTILGNAAEREKEMAKNLIKIKGKVAFLCGNVHASKQEIYFPILSRLAFKIISIFSPEYATLGKSIKPCGAHLPKKETVSYKVEALKGGNFYNFKVKKAKKYKAKKIESLPAIIKANDESYDFIYLVKKFTPSQ